MNHKSVSYFLLLNQQIGAITFLQESSKNLQAYAYVWSNKDDPDLYGEWDFEVKKPFLRTLFLSFHWCDIHYLIYWYLDIAT